MIQDLRHAFRMLLKSPGFTAVAMLTLAVGIGANTAIFSVVNAVLLRPLPYPEPDRIVRVWERTARGPRVAVSTPNFVDWRERSSAFDAISAYQGGRETVLGGAEPVFADVFKVTRGFFAIFRAEPAIGRTFVDEEQRLGGTPAVVVSHGFWTQSLGFDSDLQNLRVQVRGLSCRVVGVMPPGFAYPSAADVWIPRELFEDGTGRNGHNNAVVARVKRDIDLARAKAEMDSIAAQVLVENPTTSDAQGVTMVPLHEAISGGSRQSLLTLLAAVGLVLLIACVNVASTLLARGEERRKELAIRSALGAAHSRLVRQLLTENLLLAIGGAAGGLLLAAWLVRALLVMNPTALPRPETVGIDVPVLIFALVLAVLTPLLFGLAPSVQVSRTELRDALAAGGRSSVLPFRSRVRNVLIAVEVAVALLLLVGSVLLIRSFWNVMNVDAGFASAGVITVEMSLPGTKYPDATRASEFYRDVLPRLRAVPGVAAAGAISAFPLSGSDSNGLFAFEGDLDPVKSGTQAGYRVVTTGYFEAMGIPVIAGRTIADGDVFGRDVVTIVNKDFVAKYIGKGDPLGRRFRFLGMDSLSEPMMTIVGVVGNVKHASLVRDVAPEVYVSALQRPLRTQFTMTVAVRPAQATLGASLVPTLRETIRAADPDVPTDFSTVEERIGRSVSDRRFTMLVLGLFAGIALLLAAVGIYGVLAYSVAQRTQEIGIRMALGADPRSVVSLMLRSALGSVGAGMIAGLAAALLATRALQSFLFGVEPIDPLAFASAATLLAAVAWVAGYIPARRATRVDPLVSLRVP